MLPRLARPSVLEALDRQPAVALLGPRQSGKTTLALEIARERPSLYLDLENPDDRQKLTHATLFLEAYADRLVIFDEVHRLPDLFGLLRGLIDRGRAAGQRVGRFLLLGSAGLDLLRQSGETLAGRIAYVELTPLRAAETDGSDAAVERLWLRGGFPESYLAPSDQASLAWRRDFVRTYLERDIPQFGPRIPSQALGRIWTMLAHRQGSVLNAAELARSLEVSAQTVNRYIDLLGDLLLLRRLPPYAANVGKRLVKAPKLYLRDSGLCHALLEIAQWDRLMAHPVVGGSWEGFVIEQLLAALPPGTPAFYYRTAAGAEIDLLLERPEGGCWAIEIKRGRAARLERGFFQAQADIQPARCWVVYHGTDRYPAAPGVEAIGLGPLTDELRAAWQSTA